MPLAKGDTGLNIRYVIFILIRQRMFCSYIALTHSMPGSISPDKARKGVIYPLKTGIYALVGISERTFTR